MDDGISALESIFLLSALHPSISVSRIKSGVYIVIESGESRDNREYKVTTTWRHETTKVKVKVPQPDGGTKTEVRVVPKTVKGRDGVERGVVKKELRGAVGSMEVWALKILGRLYYHIGVEPTEQNLIVNVQ
ncbi:hypothetical protein EV368DRAFT_70467 [Lentinula lateritia]|nr:hypothetical protein EV368DRAFT_70467 [Lentinula lateritia]